MVTGCGFRPDLGWVDYISAGAHFLEGRTEMRFYTVKVPKFIGKILCGILGLWQK